MKILKKILSFLLSVIICCSVLPISVFGASDKATTSYTLQAGGNPYFITRFGDQLPLSATDSSYKQSDITSIDVDFIVKDVVAESTLQCTLVFNHGNAYRVQSFSRVRAGTVKNNSVDTDFTYNATTGTLTFSFDIDEIDGETHDGLPCVTVSVWCDVSSTSSPNASAWVSLTGVSVQSESQSKGFQNKIAAWFQNLFGWLKDIRDNALDLGNNIGNWFTQLGNNIKGFFTDLGNKITTSFTEIKNNLKTWFENVGQWFKTLGDNIKGFFDNLWDNITDKINSISVTIQNWWQGVVDFFHRLFVPEEGYFDSYKENWENWARAHFALFYDVSDLLDLCMGILSSGSEDDNPVLHIPSVKLPFYGNYEIIPQTDFDIMGFLHSNDKLVRIHQIYDIIVSVFFYSLLLRYIMKTFSKVVTGDEEAL